MCGRLFSGEQSLGCWRVSEWLAATLEMWCPSNGVAGSSPVPSALDQTAIASIVITRACGGVFHWPSRLCQNWANELLFGFPLRGHRLDHLLALNNLLGLVGRTPAGSPEEI